MDYLCPHRPSSTRLGPALLLLAPFCCCRSSLLPLGVWPPGAFDLCVEAPFWALPGAGGAVRGKIQSKSHSRFCLVAPTGAKVDAIRSSCSDRTSMWWCWMLQNWLYNCTFSEPNANNYTPSLCRWHLLLDAYPKLIQRTFHFSHFLDVWCGKTTIGNMNLTLNEFWLNCLFPRLPTGALIMSMQSLGGKNGRERRRKERLELYELRLAEWWDGRETFGFLCVIHSPVQSLSHHTSHCS